MLDSTEEALSFRKSLSVKRLNGVYYTPRPLSQAIVDWAVRRVDDAILEPSFGGCVFLESAIRRLKSIGSSDPAIHLFGSDRDPDAHTFLQRIEGCRPRNFVHADFIGLSRENFRNKAFDVIVGNPPYVSLHNMSQEQRQAVAGLGLTAPLKLDHKASLWAYFVAHSVSFLKKGGRMGFVLPSSLLYSLYGRQLLFGLEKVFRRCAVISIAEHCFRSEGAKEKVTLLLADGAFEGPNIGRTHLWGVTQAIEVQHTLAKWDDQTLKPQCINGHAVPQLLSKEHIQLSHALSESVDTIGLGELATIKIGLVTGANPFFVLSKSAADNLKIPGRLLKPIVSKFAICKGLLLTPQDFEEAFDEGERALLFSCSKGETDAATLDYLSRFPKADRENNRTFSKRPCWHRPDEGLLPDAFLTYMVKDGPRLFFNSSSPVNSTNTVHRVYFKANQSQVSRQLTAICLFSSYSQLSAEFECRTYGSGVLKIEPSEGAKIRMPKLINIRCSSVNRLVHTIDTMLRKGKRQEVVNMVDALVCKKLPQFVQQIPLKKVREALINARSRRYYSLKSNTVQEV